MYKACSGIIVSGRVMNASYLFDSVSLITIDTATSQLAGHVSIVTGGQWCRCVIVPFTRGLDWKVAWRPSRVPAAWGRWLFAAAAADHCSCQSVKHPQTYRLTVDCLTVIGHNCHSASLWFVFSARQYIMQSALYAIAHGRTDARAIAYSVSVTQVDQSTRKLSYRKDDRAMRPIYGCPEKFRESWLANGYFSRNL